MTLRIKHWVAGLIGISGIALESLVPGGPIETRSFGHMDPLTLATFNTFLTTLVLGSLLLVYFVLQSKRWATIAAAGCGLSYLGVYGLDLVKIFPVSPDAMPPALLAIEVLGTVLSLPLMVLSVQAWQRLDRQYLAARPFAASNDNPMIQVNQPILISGLALIGLGIVTFATRSAMGL